MTADPMIALIRHQELLREAETRRRAAGPRPASPRRARRRTRSLVRTVATALVRH